MLEFKGNRAWATKEISESGAKGSWTQRVTEVTDEPRYEGYGKWIHHHGSSEWTSSLSNRPLPRREYTKRSDYDLLYVINRHTVTPNGWYHEQDNTKWIKRDGKDQPLCREIGFNEYTRIKDGDFAKANAYWEKTHVFWKQVRQVWDSSLADHSEIRLQDKVNGESFDETIGKLTKSASKGETLTNEKIQAALSPFLVTTPKPR
ncbi:MAG: hypothetical protein HC767_06145 [Akkermansiaceae bacterium]|nr:hypothetical protein [Akkermansiaceae bacterium]